MSEVKGYLGFVFHAHLPYVLRHGIWPHGAEWLYEAASETYIPLLEVFYKLLDEGISPKVTLSITPVLAEQLQDEEFKEGLEQYIRSKIKSAEADEKEWKEKGFKKRAEVAQRWRDFYGSCLAFFRQWHRDLLSAYRELYHEGHIEIITSAATHGYLPLLKREESIRLQIRQGIKTHRRLFGRDPIGIWPPELAYRPSYSWATPFGGMPYRRKGLEEFYFEEGIKYFLVDAHLLRGGRAIGTYLSLFEGLKTLWERFEKEYKELEEREKSPHFAYYASSGNKPKPVAFFTRDPKTALQVWSREWGYPGDPAYLEFHKRHYPGGHRYWRVTDHKADLAEKEEYDPDLVDIPLNNQSDHFVSLVKEIVAGEKTKDGRLPIVVAPYDAELFGHWWFEGPRWLYLVIKKLNSTPELRTITLSEYLERHEPEEVIALPEGSWGEGGFHWVWLNEWTEWTWKHIYQAEDKVAELLEKGISEEIKATLLKQLLLLQSSDWQFLITTWSARDYAEQRFSEHFEDLMKVVEIAEKAVKEHEISHKDAQFLRSLNERDRLFPDIDSEDFAE